MVEGRRSVFYNRERAREKEIEQRVSETPKEGSERERERGIQKDEENEWDRERKIGVEIEEIEQRITKKNKDNMIENMGDEVRYR